MPQYEAVSKIADNDYAGAIVCLKRLPHLDPSAQNTLGVCLLRAGRITEAIEVYRRLTLVTGTVIFRSETPDVWKRNFATGVLLSGSPSGALSILEETRDHETLIETRLRVAILDWQKSLPWWRRVDWLLNRIEPKNCSVPLNFEYGEFDFEVVRNGPSGNSGNPLDLAA